MKKRVTILATEIGGKVETLLKIYKSNPKHARVFYLSYNDWDALEGKQLIKEEYFNEDGTRNESKFRLYQKVVQYSVDENLKLIKRKSIPLSYSYNNGTFKRIAKKRESNTRFLSGYEDRDSLGEKNCLNLYKILRNEFNMNYMFKDIILREWLTAFPWMVFLAEHKILLNIPFNTLYKEKIFTLKKALLYAYGLPYPVSNEVNLMFSGGFKYFLDKVQKDNPDDNVIERIIKANNLRYGAFDKYEILPDDVDGNILNIHMLSHNFFNQYHDVLTNKENFNKGWLYDNQSGKLAWNVCKFAKLMDRRVNCKWSEGKLNDINNRWTKEYASIIYKYENEPLKISEIFKSFETRTGIHMIKDLEELSYEGYRMNHCVGGYKDTIAVGDCAIYNYKNFTFSLGWTQFDSKYNLSETRRSKGLRVTEFRGFSNCGPTRELRKEVERIVVEFNRYLLTIPFEQYELYRTNIVEANEAFAESRVEGELGAHQLGRPDYYAAPPNFAREININVGVFDANGGNVVRGETVNALDDLRNLLDRYRRNIVEVEQRIIDDAVELGQRDFIEENEIEDGEIITTEDGDGNTYDFAVVDGGLQLITEITPENEANFENYIQENEIELVDPVMEVEEINEEGPGDDGIVHGAVVMAEPEDTIIGWEGSSTLKSMNVKKTDFYDVLGEIIKVYEEEFADEFVNESPCDYGHHMIRDLFGKVVDFIYDADSMVTYKDFAFENRCIIYKASSSLDKVTDEVMRDIVTDIEEMIELKKNPYYDLLQDLRLEMIS